RGLSLIFIFVDHVPDNVLSYLTLQSFSFCDAAEVFIFISGYAAAIVYGKALQRRGSIIATAQIYRRVWQLYVAHIFLFVIFAALVFYATLNVQHQDYKDRKSTRLNSSHDQISYAVFCLKKKHAVSRSSGRISARPE